MIKVHIFHTGNVIVDRAIPFHESNPLAVTGFLRGEDKKLTLPVSCYLIEHPQGRILIDTGWDAKYAHVRPKRFFGILDGISSPVIKENEGIDTRLRQLGLAAEDIDCVFFSHLDFDHTSGVSSVRNAHRFMAAKEELQDADRYFFRYVKQTWKDIRIDGFECPFTGIGPIGRSYDVFHDGTVEMIRTPGHSHGHCSVRIRNGEKYVILAGDSVYTQRSIREHIIPGFTVDQKLAQRSTDWICACAQDPNCILAAPNHDPDTPEQTIEL